MSKEALLIIALILLTACHSSRHPQVDSQIRPGQESILKAALSPDENHGIDNLVILGDSLSDTGRLHRFTLGLYMPPDVYWRGRVTNGPNWVDYVCGALSCRNQNYAVAGAATRLSTLPLRWILRPLDAQVEEFLHDQPPPHPARTVAVIWIGANNYLRRLEMRADKAREDIKASAVELLKGPVQRLLIGSMPQLGGIPKNPQDPDPVSVESYRQITAIHNRNIRGVIDELQSDFPGKSIALYDSHEINEATVERPLDFGFSNDKDPCYRGNYRGQYEGDPAFCKDYMAVKYWDYTHPNSRMHCLYAVRFILSLHEAGWLQQFDADRAIDICRHL